MIIVTRENFLVTCFRLAEKVKGQPIATDTETEGLRPYNGYRLFSIIISTLDEDYYFNFNNKPDVNGDLIPYQYILDYDKIYYLQGVYDAAVKVYFSNAKFDMHFLANEGINFDNVNVLDTVVLGRLVKNNHHSYSLAASAARIGFAKDKTVEEYIAKNKVFTTYTVEGKTQKQKDLHYDLVPFKLIAPYGCTDGNVTLKLGEYLIDRLTTIAVTTPQGAPNIQDVLIMECKLIKVLFAMERRGIKVDLYQTRQAYEYEKKNIQLAKYQFKELVGWAFTKDSALELKKAFGYFDIESPDTTPTGRPSFKDDTLEKIDHELARIMQRYRAAYKLAYTYYANFLILADKDGRIHCSFNQSGTLTGRLSCSNPNLQNVPKRNDVGKYKCRGLFIPDDKFLMVDYSQLEYRLMVDYAEELTLIDMILNRGLDVHTATAELANVDRDTAKTVNFLTIYGGGVGKLALSLKISESSAARIRSQVLGSIPKVRSFVDTVIRTTKARGNVFNWLGRRCYSDRGFEYKAPNHLIQGGGADVVKIAMIKLHEFLKDKKTVMLLNVHDEIVFNLAEGEEYIIKDIKKIMESAYPHKFLPLEVTADISVNNWYDKEPLK